MISSCVFPASQTSGNGTAANVRRAFRVERKGGLRRAGWLILAVASAITLNLLVSLQVQAAGWTLPEDTGHLKFNTSRQATADSNNRAALEPRSEKIGVKPYIEYGLTDSITMGVNNEYQLVKSGLENDRAGRTDGFMNTELFLRGRLRDQDWYMLSVQDLVRLPGQEAVPSFSQADSNVRIQYGRSGETDLGSWTSSVKTGFHPSLDHTPEKLQADLSLGWRPADRWQLTAQSINSIAVDSEVSKGQLSVTRSLSDSLSLQVGGWQMVSGETTGHSSGFDAIIWLRY